MEVIEGDAQGLERRFTVKVPAAELDAKLVERLQGMKSKVHLKGFRKGKAPISYLKKMYGKGVMSEIVQEVVSETSAKAFADRDLQPASAPNPQFHGDLDQVMAGEADLEYEVCAEILPSIEPMDVSSLTLERPVASPPEEDIEAALNDLAENNRAYEPRDAGEAAEDGDLVVIDYVGKIDGEPFDGGRGAGHQLVLGSGQFIEGFEGQLVGAKADEDRLVEATFPESYRVGELGGKVATFDVHVHEVKKPMPATVDDALAEKLGVETVDELRARVQERFDREYADLSRAHLKRALLDRLDEAHDFALPTSMVEAEFEQIWRQVEAAEPDEEDKDKSEDELKAEYRSIAERRVRLGLVLAEIGKRADVQVPSDELQRAVQEQAVREAQMMRMQGQDVSPQQVLQFYRQSPEALAQIRAPLFEEKVVDYIIERAAVTEKSVSKDELYDDPKGADEA